MKEHEESMAQLGRVVGLTRSQISSWATGRCESYKREEYLHKIAQHYHVSIGELVGEEGESSYFLSQFKRKPEIRDLFYAAVGASKEDIAYITKLLKALKIKSQSEKEECSVE
jgi:transcriptional regulator with XRE-family HTH domain